MEIVILSTLGRHVSPGDLYNYASDEITHIDPSVTQTLERTVVDLSKDEGSSVKSQLFFNSPYMNDMKWNHLKLNAHMKASVLADTMLEKLWFSPYLLNNPFYEEHNSSACLVVHLRAYQRREEMKLDEVTRLISRLSRGGNSNELFSNITHIIQQVTYGLNVILVFEKHISSPAQKKEMESLMFSQIKKAFDQMVLALFKDQSTDSPPNFSVLDSCSCRIFSDIPALDIFDGAFGIMSYERRQSFLKALCYHFHKDACTPVEMKLLPVEGVVSHLNIPRVCDLDPDTLTQLCLLKTAMHQVSSRCDFLVKDSFWDRIPSFMKMQTEEFWHLTQVLSSKISSSAFNAVINFRRFSPGATDSLFGFWNTFFCSNKSVLDYVIAQEQELAFLQSFLKEINVPFKSFDQLESLYGGTNARVEIFFLKTKVFFDNDMADWRKLLQIPDEENHFTALELNTHSTAREIQNLRDRLIAFQEQNTGTLCFISTSDSKPSGSLVSWNRPLDQSGFSPTTSVDSSYQAAPITVPRPFTQPALDFYPLPTSMVNDNEFVSSQLMNLNLTDSVAQPPEEDSIDSRISNTYSSVYESEDSYMAEKFIKGSELAVNGNPKIYQLKSNEWFTVDQEIRWLQLGPTSGVKKEKPHFVLFLMGSILNERSTLIDGIINYVLGVEWNDSFRFKITDGLNSRKNCITAYSIGHIKGMKINYDLTIIDSPWPIGNLAEKVSGITWGLGRFLNHPHTRSLHLDHVNALCLVTSPIEFTEEQQHKPFLDSSSFLFGWHLRDSVRILVNLNEGVEPEASQYSKFDTSVLFAPYLSSGTHSLAEWDSLHTHFNKFFTMVSSMPSTSLEQIRQLLDNRICLEQSFKDIEGHLEIAWQKIENLQEIQHIMLQLDHSMKINRNYEIEEVRWVSVKASCNWMSPSAFNCTTCRKTCGKQDFGSAMNVLQNYGMNCPTCGCPISIHQDQNFRWRLRQERIKTVSQEKKDEYHVSAGRKVAAQAAMDQLQGELVEIKRKILIQLEKIIFLLQSIDSITLQNEKIYGVLSDCVNHIMIRAELEKRPGYEFRNRILLDLFRIVTSNSTSI